MSSDKTKGLPHVAAATDAEIAAAAIAPYVQKRLASDRKSTRLNSSHITRYRMPSSA